MTGEGEIHILMGCMYAGKTSELVRRLSRYESIDLKVLLVSPQIDTRGSDSVICHDGHDMKALKISKLKDLFQSQRYKDSTVIGIDEGQFFSDLFEFCKVACEKDHKHIVVASLDSAYERKPFSGDIMNVCRIADSIIKLYAFCGICKNGTRAIFTRRIKQDTKQELIGGKDAYISVCRKHYNT